MDFRKISIITPSLNRAGFLEGAIQSVQAQNYDNYEHIIIDGGSIDQTSIVVRKYPNIIYFCEPDQGMYDALNKGLALATGEIIGFLNTDDLYEQDIFNEVTQYFEDNSLMAVTGEAIVITKQESGNIEIVDRYIPVKAKLIQKFVQNGPFFNAWFFKRNVFDLIGGFNSSYKISGDLDFMLRFAISEFSFISIKKTIYIYRQHEGSLTFGETRQQRIASAKETLMISRHYLQEVEMPKRTKNLIKTLHTRESAELALQSLWIGDTSDIIDFIFNGVRFDFLFFIRFLVLSTFLGMKYLLKQLKKLSDNTFI
jgi:glycosyltransferase involved in cell wall biosynthesis